jgi:UPF0755 protein
LKFLAKLLLVALLLVAACAAYFWYCLEKPFGTIPSEGVFVEVPHGASQRSVAHLLRDAGILRNSIAFEIYARRHPRRRLEAGEYFFDHALTGKEVFWKLANGEIFQQPFTVREGETIFDIARDLQTAKYMQADLFLAAAQDASQIQDLAPGATSLEGFLFPATYNLPRNATSTELTGMMVRKFREAIAQIGPKPINGDDSSHSVLAQVTLASLVERETPKAEERPLVAGVFTNRLLKDMPLQCDPTVIYALEKIGRYNGTLTGKDLRMDSPYNTYIHTGLPPGPIGNPSEQSLRAAWKPAETNFLYFVANTRGGHFFAATLAEHNQNVNKYHRLLAGESAAGPSTSNMDHSNAGELAHKGKQ